MGVTKVFCADEKLVKAYIDGGIDYIGESRIENLMKVKNFDIKKVLLRLPMISQTDLVVKYADISLNSELKTIAELNNSANKMGLVHEIILMIDLGDLREGILPKDVSFTVREILKFENIKLTGIGVNLTCYGGVIPTFDNLSILASIKESIELEFGVKLEIISGGNSSSLYLLGEDKMPKEITNLRLGEALVLGRETAYGFDIKNTYNDVFTLEAEIIELKEKDTVPTGNIGMDAFGNKPSFVDKGRRMRGIVAVGRQDINPSNLIPMNNKVEIFGASSDHLILDLTDTDFKIGDKVAFRLEYGALLNAFTSEYIFKNYV
jgi:predicted amino acid racemase